MPEILRSASLYAKRPNYYRLAGMNATRPYAVAYRKGRELSLMERQLVEAFRSSVTQA